MTRGRLITIEGIDGAGKSTLAGPLVEHLRSCVGAPVELLREPGGVRAAELVRSLVGDPALRVGARAEALLYAAARAQLVEERVAPLLEAGGWVVLDRFIDSSLAYQGGGRALGVEHVREINAFATGGLEADRTLLLVVDPAAGRARRGARAQDPDRLELEGEPFFARISATYEQLALHSPERIRRIDASRAPDVVLAAALAALADLLPR
ncbi:MAG: dTMP kinase [Solirubrobacteraceae bacterium]